MQRIKKPAIILTTLLVYSVCANADDGTDGAKKAAEMITAVTELAQQAHRQRNAQQQLIDAGALVEKRSTIIQHQAKCLEHGYSCIQAGDLGTMRIGPGSSSARREPRGANTAADSSSLQSMMAPRQNKKMPPPLTGTHITWQGNDSQSVTLLINGMTVTAPIGGQVDGSTYRVKSISPTKVVLSDQGGRDRIIPVVWPQRSAANTDQGNRVPTGFNLPSVSTQVIPYATQQNR